MGLISSSGNAVWIQGFWRQMGWIICWRNTADFNPAEIAYLFLQSISKRAVLCSLTKWERWDSLWAAARFQFNRPLFSPFSSIYNIVILLVTTFWHSFILLWVGGMMTTTTSCKSSVHVLSDLGFHRNYLLRFPMINRSIKVRLLRSNHSYGNRKQKHIEEFSCLE